MWFKGLSSDDASRLVTRRNIISRLPLSPPLLIYRNSPLTYHEYLPFFSSFAGRTLAEKSLSSTHPFEYYRPFVRTVLPARYLLNHPSSLPSSLRIFTPTCIQYISYLSIHLFGMITVLDKNVEFNRIQIYAFGYNNRVYLKFSL